MIEIAPWSIGWSKEVVFGGRKIIFTFSCGKKGWAGQLSTKRRQLKARLLSLQNTFIVGTAIL